MAKLSFATSAKKKQAEIQGTQALALPATPEDSLSYHLHRHLAGSEPGRPLTTIHASSVTREDWCAREVALRLLLNRPPSPEWAGTVTRMVWIQGRLLAERMARMISQELPDVEVVADWSCTVCGRLHRFQKKPAGCELPCTGRLFWYREVRVVSQDSGVGCGLDLLVRLPGRQRYTLVELKTIDKEDFKKLEAPLQEARDRTRIYLRAVAESDHPNRDEIDTDEARILYISKGGWGKKRPHPAEWDFKDQGYTPFREFRVARADDQVEVYVAKARPLHHWMRGEGGLPSGICTGPLCARAQQCSVRKQCYGGKYPPGSHEGAYGGEA